MIDDMVRIYVHTKSKIKNSETRESLTVVWPALLETGIENARFSQSFVANVDKVFDYFERRFGKDKVVGYDNSTRAIELWPVDNINIFEKHLKGLD